MAYDIGIGVTVYARAGGRGQTKTRHDCRVCGANAETVVQVVLHCPAIAATVWPVVVKRWRRKCSGRGSQTLPIVLWCSLDQCRGKIVQTQAFFRRPAQFPTSSCAIRLKTMPHEVEQKQVCSVQLCADQELPVAAR